MSNNQRSNEPTTVLSYVFNDLPATLQFVMRSITFFSSTLFLFSGLLVSGEFAYRCYLIAFLAGFFTYVIRFHYRMNEAQVSLFSRAALNLFTTEDSGHYMIYTFFFYNQYPTTIYILPILFYSILLTMKYIQGLLPFLPPVLHNITIKIINIISSKQPDIHRFIAYCEVFIFIILLWKVITGYVFILAPYLYYYFLKMRYTSRRNPSVRIVFAELNQSVQALAHHPKCPPFISTTLLKIVAFISRLNPLPGTEYNPQNPS